MEKAEIENTNFEEKARSLRLFYESGIKPKKISQDFCNGYTEALKDLAEI
jgi:hypothetical protein